MNKEGIAYRSIRTLVKLALGLAVVGIVIFAGLAIYNAFDEELSAESKAALAPPKMGTIDDKNGYVAFLGMVAPKGEDQVAWGRKAAEAFAAQAKPDFKKSPEWENAVKSHLPANKTPAWCIPEAAACLPLAKERGQDLEKLLAAERSVKLLGRYRKTREAPTFSDIYPGPDILIKTPTYAPLLEGAALVRLEIAMKANAGDLDWASAELEREAAFHRRMIAGAGMLAPVMIGNRLLAFDLLTASELLRTGGEQLAPYRARIHEIAKTPGGARMLEAPLAYEVHKHVVFAGDLREKFRDQRMRDYYSVGYSMGFAETLNPLVAWTLSFFVRSNETTNLAAKHYGLDQALTRVPAAEFAAAVQAAQQAKAPLLEREWYQQARNPVGRSFVAIATSGLYNYPSRMHDLDALARMVDLQVTLADRGISDPAAIAAFVAGEGAKTHVDPFTGKAFAFDPATRQLSFSPLYASSLRDAMQKRYQQKGIVIVL